MRLFNFELFQEVVTATSQSTAKSEFNDATNLQLEGSLTGNAVSFGHVTLQDIADPATNAGFNIVFDSKITSSDPLSLDYSISSETDAEVGNAANDVVRRNIAITNKRFEG